MEAGGVLVFAASPVIDKAIALVDPLFDKKTADEVREGKITEKEAYEKTKAPTGPVSPCDTLNCPEKFLKCPKFHEGIDCEEWVRSKTSCNGTCGKYHRVWIGGRGVPKGLTKSGSSHTTKGPIAVSPEMPVYGKLTVVLKKDMASTVVWEKRKVTLSAGVFDLNGELLHKIYPDPNIYTLEGRTVGLEHFGYGDGAITHSGDDTDDPDPGVKPTTFGFNQAISIDFSKLPEEVGTIVIGITIAWPENVEHLKHSEVSIFSTPKSPGETKDILLTIPLEPQIELHGQPGYIFGKFVRTSAGWKFVTIRETNGSTSGESMADHAMNPYARESTSTFIPGPISDLDFHILSFSKDLKYELPIKSIGVVSLNYAGNRLKDENIFEQITKDDSNEISLRFKNKAEPVATLFIYIEHEPDAKGTTCFMAGTKDNPIVCNIANIGAPVQLIARVTCILNGEMMRSRWQISTYAIPLAQKNGELESIPKMLMDRAHAHKLVPLVTKGISQIRAGVLSSGKHGNIPAERLIVEVICGKDLAVKDIKSSDPFVIVSLEHHKHKTPVIRSNLNPVWNSRIEFNFEDVVEPKPVIKFKCKDWNLISSAKAMGVAKFDLADLLSTTLQYGAEITLQLETDPKHPKQAVSGCIVVKVHFG
eukprot:Phypoly_transcript_05107.p1 GENE.Phypoly_transcript_05107~~Phypoly_transcript_05107.p1  ORF type:complete len:647 (+),score=54.34 Phypoly_transcript_05107:20-1960(+)